MRGRAGGDEDMTLRDWKYELVTDGDGKDGMDSCQMNTPARERDGAGPWAV